ncbi:MAG: glycosyltransferase family A protein, partial [Pseudomonadota bacterium]
MKDALQSHDEPRVAVVVPIFRHSVLLVEAIETVLAQQAPFGIAIILVNDGCPHQETDDVCRHYSRLYPDRIIYLRKPNGGLSDARNHGVRYVLANLTTVRAVFFLDADNGLRPPALARAYHVLETCPDVGWVYPNIDMFGVSSAHDYGGTYSRLLHSDMNICEAGSLIRREVFDAGVFFDTDFKSGFEDWEFFLSAARAGFKGQNLEDFGFRYRKRPESMLADSERDAAGITALLRKKHKGGFTPRALIALEQAEMPRLAIVLSDIQQVIFTTDPARKAETLSVEDFIHRYFLAKSNPSRDWVPPYLCVTTTASFQALGATGLLHAAFWHLEALADATNLAILTAAGLGEDRMGLVLHPNAQTHRTDPSLLMIGQSLLRDIIFDAATTWIESLATTAPQPKLAQIELRLPTSYFDILPLAQGTAIFDFLTILHRLRASVWCEGAKQRLDWRQGDLTRREASHLILRRHIAQEPAYPRVPDGGRDIGLILPLVEFGGVEKVALNFARAIRDRGDRPHLFVLNQADAAISADWRKVFDSITFYADAGFGAWGGGTKTYFGTEVPRWADFGNHDRAVAMLHWLD